MSYSIGDFHKHNTNNNYSHNASKFINDIKTSKFDKSLLKDDYKSFSGLLKCLFDVSNEEGKDFWISDIISDTQYVYMNSNKAFINSLIYGLAVFQYGNKDIKDIEYIINRKERKLYYKFCLDNNKKCLVTLLEPLSVEVTRMKNHIIGFDSDLYITNEYKGIEEVPDSNKDKCVIFLDNETENKLSFDLNNCIMMFLGWRKLGSYESCLQFRNVNLLSKKHEYRQQTKKIPNNIVRIFLNMLKKEEKGELDLNHLNIEEYVFLQHLLYNFGYLNSQFYDIAKDPRTFNAGNDFIRHFIIEIPRYIFSCSNLQFERLFSILSVDSMSRYNIDGDVVTLNTGESRYVDQPDETNEFLKHSRYYNTKTSYIIHLYKNGYPKIQNKLIPKLLNFACTISKYFKQQYEIFISTKAAKPSWAKKLSPNNEIYENYSCCINIGNFDNIKNATNTFQKNDPPMIKKAKYYKIKIKNEDNVRENIKINTIKIVPKVNGGFDVMVLTFTEKLINWGEMIQYNETWIVVAYIGTIGRIYPYNNFEKYNKNNSIIKCLIHLNENPIKSFKKMNKKNETCVFCRQPLKSHNYIRQNVKYTDTKFTKRCFALEVYKDLM